MTAPVVLCLPIADRSASYAFYRALGLPVVGEPGDDGLPEPLQLAPREGVRIMLIPAGGFGWVLSGREPAPRGRHECVVALPLEDAAAVDAFVDRARVAGAEIVAGPAAQSWGEYATLFADPDGHLWQVTSTPAPG